MIFCEAGLRRGFALARCADMFPDHLTSGYRSFLKGRFAERRARYESFAATGQHPEVMIIGCVDSRVSPEIIFEAAPGELLVVRNVANIVPPYQPGDATLHGVSAALEFGVMALRVRHIVVLGHASCGGVKAFADEAKPLSPGDFIGRWVSQIAPAAQRLGPPSQDLKDWLTRLEFAVIELSLSNLLTFPWIRARVDQGVLELTGPISASRKESFWCETRKTASSNPLSPRDQSAPDEQTARNRTHAGLSASAGAAASGGLFNLEEAFQQRFERGTFARA